MLSNSPAAHQSSIYFLLAPAWLWFKFININIHTHYGYIHIHARISNISNKVGLNSVHFLCQALEGFLSPVAHAFSFCDSALLILSGAIMMFPDDNFRQGCVPIAVQPGFNKFVVLLEDARADPTFLAASGRSRFRSGHQIEVPVFFSGCKHIPGFGQWHWHFLASDVGS